MIGGGVVLDVAEPRPPLPGERVVDAVRQAREREQRVGRAPAAEIDLERVRAPAVLDRDGREVDGGAPDHALPREPAPDLQPLARQLGRVRLIGREVTPEVRLTVGAPEHLVVGGHDVDLSRRAHAELHARAPETRPLDALLDDPALVVERGEVLVDGELRVLDLDRRRQVVAGGEVDEGVPEPTHTLVELEHCATGFGAPLPQLADGCRKVSPALHVVPHGVRHVLLLEHPAASRLRAEPVERRVGAVRREAEPNCEIHLVVGHAEGQEKGELGIADQAADAPNGAGPREQLPRQRLVAAVDERDGDEAVAGLGRVELGDEPEVVVDEPRMDGLRRHVDNARPGRAEQAQHEAEEALLVRRKDRNEVVRDVEADRVRDDHRSLDVAERAEGDAGPELAEPGLKLREGRLAHRT